MLKGVFSIFHLLSGKAFWFTSAYFPETHVFRIFVENSLLKFYQMEIRFSPDFPDAYSKAASLLANRGRTDQAISYYEKALETHHPDSAKIHYFIGKQKLRQADTRAATECFRRFVRIAAESKNIEPEYIDQWCRLEEDWQYKPHWFDGYYFLGDKCIKNGFNSLAIEFLRKSVILEPLVVRGHLGLAEALYLSGRSTEALAATRSGHYFQLRKSHPALGIYPYGGKNVTKPDFMILGVMKGGTTSLYSYLTQHPCIAPALNKEIEFFTTYYDRGLEWYLAQFPPIGDRPELITGEASVEYFDNLPAANLIKQHYPDTRFIVLLRDPVERAISHYHMAVRLGHETGEMESTLLEGVYPASESDQPNRYVNRSSYIKMIKSWMALYPREQFLILSSEQLFAQPAGVCNQVFKFLQQVPFTSDDYRVRNKGIYPSADDSLRQRLRGYLRPYNRELEKFLGMRFGWDD